MTEPDKSKDDLAREVESLHRQLTEAETSIARQREIRDSLRIRAAAAEDALRASEATARAFLESASEGVLIVDSRGHIALVNAALERMFGYPRAELLGQSLEILLPERARRAHAAYREAYFAEPRVRGMGQGLDLAGRHKDGSEFPVEISLSYVRTDAGLFAMGFVTDITQRKQAERRLAAQFAVTLALAESATLDEATPRLLQAICDCLGWDYGELWRVDAQANVLRLGGLWHKASLEATEFEGISQKLTFSPGEGLPGRVWSTGQPIWIPDVTREACYVRAEPAKQIGLHAGAVFPIRLDHETMGVIAFLSREIREPDEDLLRMMADVGDRIGQHMKHQQVRVALHQSDKLAALGRLVAGVAHELNNPLGILSSRLELMLLEADEHPLPPGVAEDLRVLHRHTQRVTRVAQALLSFARQSRGDRVPVDLNAIVEETLALARRPIATDGVRIRTTLDRTLPPLVADATGLGQVLLNLLTNAREAMPDGGEIRIETGPAPGRPGWVRLLVADSGPGILAEHVPKIFDPFFTTKPAGTGLGLSVSYGIIQDHKGSVDVQSVPGKGTTFVLSLPLSPPEDPDL